MADDYPYKAADEYGTAPAFDSREPSTQGNPLLLVDCALAVFAFVTGLGFSFYTYAAAYPGSGKFFFLAARAVPGLLAGAATFYGNVRLYAGRNVGLIWTFAAAVYHIITSLHGLLQTSVHLLVNNFQGSWMPFFAVGPSLLWNCIFAWFLLRYSRGQ